MVSGDGKWLTIIIPVRNRAGIVARTLDSILAQDGIQNCSLIIVDNNSTDDTRDVLARWAEVNRAVYADVRLMSEPVPGAPAARNCGLKHATTPWVMFFDSDDLMIPGLVSSLHDCVMAGDADLIGWNVEIELASGEKRTSRFGTGNAMWNHLVHAILATQHYSARRELFLKVGGWNETAFGWDDYELGIRLLLVNPRVKVVGPGTLVHVRFTEDSITGRRYSDEPQKWEHALDLSESALKRAGRYKAIEWLNVRRVILAAEYAKEGAEEDSARLLGTVLGGTGFRQRFKYRLIYLKHRLYRRGTGRFATLFFPRKI